MVKRKGINKVTNEHKLLAYFLVIYQDQWTQEQDQ